MANPNSSSFWFKEFIPSLTSGSPTLSYSTFTSIMAPSNPSSQSPPSTETPTLERYAHAAAGHEGVQCDVSGEILVKPCTAAEVAFYESAYHYKDFQNYMPLFLGTIQRAEDGKMPDTSNVVPPAWTPSGGKKLKTGISIVLENVTAGFKNPTVIDLKLGKRLWADDAHDDKRRKLEQVSMDTTSGTLGFRVAGMILYRPDQDPKQSSTHSKHITAEDGGYVRYDKGYGKSIKSESILDAFVEFFGGPKALADPGANKHVVKRLAEELRGLVSVLETVEIRMYSASILMVYEGDESAMQEALDAEKGKLSGNQQNGEAIESTGKSSTANSTGLEEQKTEVIKSGPQSAENGGSLTVPQPSDDTNGVEEDDEDDDSDDEEVKKICDMRLIDFAHATWVEGSGPDENVLQGAREVLKILDQLIK